MSNNIGLKSGKDWSEAPDGATHVRDDGVSWYKYEKGRLYYDPYFAPFMGNGWSVSDYANVEFFNRVGGAKLISKEEDLGMVGKIVKSVSKIEDVEKGMFLQGTMFKWHVIIATDNSLLLARDGGNKVHTARYPEDFLEDSQKFHAYWGGWSYTYNGEYTPIVKETEEECKIKELEATIELAQKQLQEYKRMK